MSTLEEFENAPPGATATHPDGRRAVGTFDYDGERWYGTDYDWLTDGDMVKQGYILDSSTPVPEPDWLDAPAVLAAMNDCSWQKVWLPSTPGYWTCTCCGAVKHWTNMADVTPLWPKEDTPHDAPGRRTFSFRDDKPWGTRLGGDPA